MKLSIITNPITAMRVKAIMSSTTGNEVKNRSLIREETAKANGFNSFEQASFYFDREKRINKSLWAERNSDGNLVFVANNLHVLFQKTQVVIYDSFKDSIKIRKIPNKMMYLDYSDDHVYFNHKEKTITLKNGNKNFSIVIKRIKNVGINVDFIDHHYGYDYSSYKIDEVFTDYSTNANLIASDHTFQVMRLMAEIAMTCEYDITPYLNEYNLSEDDVKNILDTSLFLFEQSKEHYIDDKYDITPKKFFKQGMGYLAHIFLENAYLEDKLGQANRKSLFDSLSITDENEFEELKYMAKASHNWFKFSYIKNS
jgi:hypothetical protein